MPDLDDATLDAMLDVARAATPGPWEAVSEGTDPDSADWYVDAPAPDMRLQVAALSNGGDEETARHIAAASPDRVIALVEEVRRLRAERQAREETKKS